jgi:hypothetical protein
MFEPAGRTIQKFFLFEDDAEALLTNSVPAI